MDTEQLAVVFTQFQTLVSIFREITRANENEKKSNKNVCVHVTVLRALEWNAAHPEEVEA